MHGVTSSVVVSIALLFVQQRLERQWNKLHWTRVVSAAVRSQNTVSAAAVFILLISIGLQYSV